MAAISMRGLRKMYGKVQVIHGLDAEIADGAFVVIVGPSGCGKSTLLRMVAGLESITAGEIEIGGRVVNALEPKDRDIAMVFQNYALYPHMSVFQNMAYGLKIAGTPKDEIRRRVDEAAGLLQLSGLLERKPRQLSGGQRQRVAMGRAIVRQPEVFLFDEPLSNLDAKLRVQMRLEIKQLQRRLGTTSLYVTHDQVEAMTLGDLLIVMNAGVAEQIDHPLAIYERPASVFVAGFIGSPSMNFLPAKVEGGRLQLASGEIVPAPHLALDPHEGRAFTLGIRPEHLVPSPEGLPMRIELVETLGADTLAHGPIGEGGPLSALRLPGGSAVAAGETLALAATPEHLHLFDAESGRRVEV